MHTEASQSPSSSVAKKKKINLCTVLAKIQIFADVPPFLALSSWLLLAFDNLMCRLGEEGSTLRGYF